MSVKSLIPDLTGKVAVVTGASRGIGREVALALARAGCGVCVAARSEEGSDQLPGSIHETCRAIEEMGRPALAVKADVRNEEEVASMVGRAADQLGGVDIFIHNAGALFWKDLIDTPVKRFDLVMDVNARGAFIGCRECIPYMKERGGGHILLFSPPIDLRYLPGKVGYFMSKFSMTMIAHGLADEVKEEGISVNALWPATLIESQATINHKLGRPEMWRKAAIIADAALVVLSKSAAQLTGRALLDEDVLRDAGVTDLSRYNCVPGGSPVRLVGDEGLALWQRARHHLNE